MRGHYGFCRHKKTISGCNQLLYASRFNNLNEMDRLPKRHKPDNTRTDNLSSPSLLVNVLPVKQTLPNKSLVSTNKCFS